MFSKFFALINTVVQLITRSDETREKERDITDVSQDVVEAIEEIEEALSVPMVEEPSLSEHFAKTDKQVNKIARGSSLLFPMHDAAAETSVQVAQTAPQKKNVGKSTVIEQEQEQDLNPRLTKAPVGTPLARYQENSPQYFVKEIPQQQTQSSTDSFSISQQIDPHDPQQRLTPSADDLYIESEENRIPKPPPPPPIPVPPSYVAPPRSIPSMPAPKRVGKGAPVGRLMKPKKTNQDHVEPQEMMLDPDKPTRNHQQEIANRIGSFLGQSHGPMSAENPRLPPRYHDAKAEQNLFEDVSYGGDNVVELGRRRGRRRKKAVEEIIEPTATEVVVPLLKTPPMRVEKGDYLRIWGHYGAQENYFNFGSLVRASKLTETLPVWWDHLEWVDYLSKTELRKHQAPETEEEKQESKSFKRLLSHPSVAAQNINHDILRQTEKQVSYNPIDPQTSRSPISIPPISIPPVSMSPHSAPPISIAPISMAPDSIPPYSMPPQNQYFQEGFVRKDIAVPPQTIAPGHQQQSQIPASLMVTHLLVSQQKMHKDQSTLKDVKKLFVGQAWSGLSVAKPTLIIFPKMHPTTIWIATTVLKMNTRTFFKMLDRYVKRKQISSYIIVENEAQMLNVLQTNSNSIAFVDQFHPIAQHIGSFSSIPIVEYEPS